MERSYLVRAQPFMNRALDVAEAFGTALEQDLIALSVALLAQASANLDTIARGEPSPYHTTAALLRVRRQLILRLLDDMGRLYRRGARPCEAPAPAGAAAAPADPSPPQYTPSHRDTSGEITHSAA